MDEKIIVRLPRLKIRFRTSGAFAFRNRKKYTRKGRHANDWKKEN